MYRLTTDKSVKEMGIYELAHNCMFVKEGEAWYRDFENEISLRNMIREIIKQYEGEYDEQLDDDELLDGVLFDNLQYPIGSNMSAFIAIFNMIAWSHADLRESLKKYEDTGMTPDEVEKLKGLHELKKPTYEGDGYDPDGTFVYDTWECPNCGECYEVDYDDYDYCPKCGQKIDWSE